MLVGQRFVWIETNSSLSFITRESMGWMSETNGIVRDGVLKSLHCVENTDWDSWSVGWEECSIMNASLLNQFYSLSWLCMNCVLIIRIMSENGDELGVAHQPLDRFVRSIDREWVDLIIRIMDWLGYGSEQWYQIVDCDEWFDKICKLSVQWFMIINEYRIQWNRGKGIKGNRSFF